MTKKIIGAILFCTPIIIYFIGLAIEIGILMTVSLFSLSLALVGIVAFGAYLFVDDIEESA